MDINKVDFSKTNTFSKLFLDYIDGRTELDDYYTSPPVVSSFKEQITSKKISGDIRKDLEKVLKEQYQHLKVSTSVWDNISSLSSNQTFTITTGHQLNIFTGPLYFIYKIIAAINVTEKLKIAYPAQHFVPVYWMASEDHDFDEISHFNLFGNDYRWEQSDPGAVGRINPRSLSGLFEQLPEKIELFETAYLQHNTLADATRYFVNELFGEYGLVVLDADHPELKKHFKAVIADDLFTHKSHGLVRDWTGQLESKGYDSQVFPRDINLFYLSDGIRERIVEKNGVFKVLNTDISFGKEEMLKMVEKQPEKFSPNVILRPLYQETILPNLAYIGGPAEVAYWLQLKGVFEHFSTPFPILMPRVFALIVTKANNRKLQKQGIEPGALFAGQEVVKEKFMSENSAGSYDLSVETGELQDLFDKIRRKATDIDKSLDGFVRAEEARTLKTFEKMGKRLKKAEEQNLATGLKQIENVFDRLFPNGNLQERTDNFLNFYLNDPSFISSLKPLLDPFDYRFNILIEHE